MRRPTSGGGEAPPRDATDGVIQPRHTSRNLHRPSIPTVHTGGTSIRRDPQEFS